MKWIVVATLWVAFITSGCGASGPNWDKIASARDQLEQSCMQREAQDTAAELANADYLIAQYRRFPHATLHRNGGTVTTRDEVSVAAQLLSTQRVCPKASARLLRALR